MATTAATAAGGTAATTGLWLVNTSQGQGLVRETTATTHSSSSNAIFLGSTASEVSSHLETALQAQGLHGTLPSNLGAAVTSAFQTGRYNFSTPSSPFGPGLLGAVEGVLAGAGVALITDDPGADIPTGDLLGSTDPANDIANGAGTNEVPTTTASSDTSNIGGSSNEGAGTATATEPPPDTTDTGGSDTGSSDTGSSDTSGEDNTASSTTSGAGAAAVGGLAGLLGLSGVSALIIRILEGIVAVAILFLGLQALTGQGSGNPVEVVTSSAKKAGSAAVAAAA